MTSMQEPTFVILTALAAGPRHGYAIIADATELTDGALHLQAGTLYAALDRLREQRLVEVASEEVVNGRLRRSYRLTADGRDAVVAEAERRRALASRALSRLRDAVARPAVAR
jgi:DNA-binding PadR family transcriptional regulator